MRDESPQREGAFPAPLDLHRLAGMPIPERVHRVGKIMPIGTAGLITGHGGMGKTQLEIDLVLAVASGGPFMGMDTLHAVSAIVSEEDDARDFHFRVAAQCRHRGMSMADVGNRLFIWPAGEDSGAAAGSAKS